MIRRHPKTRNSVHNAAAKDISMCEAFDRDKRATRDFSRNRMNVSSAGINAAKTIESTRLRATACASKIDMGLSLITDFRQSAKASADDVVATYIMIPTTPTSFSDSSSKLPAGQSSCSILFNRVCLPTKLRPSRINAISRPTSTCATSSAASTFIAIVNQALTRVRNLQGALATDRVISVVHTRLANIADAPVNASLDGSQ